MAIFVIGLGPGDSDLLTQRAKRFLDAGVYKSLDFWLPKRAEHSASEST